MRAWISGKTSKALLFLAALVPASLLAVGAWRGTLGANPIQEIQHRTGEWTIRFLLLTLAVTPLRRITGWNGAIRYRRMLGLLAFFYALSHWLTYVWLDQFFDVREILRDVAKRPFIFLGSAALLLLTPLAVTSTNRMIRRLGKRWKSLHRLVYVAAALGCLHYYFAVKADTRKPLQYAGILALLLGWRGVDYLRARKRRVAHA